MSLSTFTIGARALPPDQRAALASTVRLLSCLVTESIVRALYFPLEGFEATGFTVVLKPGVSSDHPYSNSDILAIIPLRHVPVYKHDGQDERAKEIGLLDPLDMMPSVFELSSVPNDVLDGRPHSNLSAAILRILTAPGWDVKSSTALMLNKGPLSIWYMCAQSLKLDAATADDIGEEFASAVRWSSYSFENPPPAPTFDSPSIDWEESIVEGHPTHPMHKTRRFLSPLPDFAPGAYDLYNPKLRFVAVPKGDLKITYNFEELTRPLLDAAAQRAGNPLIIPDGYAVVPIHELQVAHVQEKFSDVQVYPEEFNLDVRAQQSIRSVIIPNVYHELSLKLGVGIKLTSAVRTISPESAYLGPRFSSQVVPFLELDPEIVTVAKELASVVHAHPNGEIGKHCAAIVRECYENTSEERGERLIVCTSLVESGHSGEGGDVPPVIRVFNLDTEDKRAEWLDKFVAIFFRAFIPSVLKNGVAFECHPQNCLARFDLKTKELKGFIIRDFGGLRIHPPTLYESTGVELDFLSGHSIIADDLEDVYTRMYHTVFHNHLQQLIRVLGLHYNGRGWDIVRKNLRDAIPQSHPLWATWMSPERKTFPGKCFMRMRMSGMYRFHLHGPFPNLIHYTGTNEKSVV
ncbi:hypothetical protein AGABI1DRAFT_121041 [Agaricus bisporus var. burnettii JB137-S8]|uniref:IucC family-domain-containing protein n=2 Tax=Agaricus bisporus var. burnettii TaxID=192524 RepID=K5VVX3_AGABU|nr:uncharacterized protein AGABI1DRAFT_121041 [Agaricus bisporus var. burnettii JB137-S8]EKM78594.1 hypothetical protein AGABI1DRAFT_121041 [Agaricus bisporus var. burnettii JB137-S8]KAF7773336.1 hypothetical protein Agabi119p4_5503 [Agaricus bisporus var. burnettii]